MNENISATNDPLRTLVARWRQDPGGTFRSWFLWEERLKNFRSIRRGLEVVVAEIEYSELREHRLDMARFGSGLKAVQAVARPLRLPGAG